MDDAAREIAELSSRWDVAIRERDASAAAQILHEEYRLVLVQPAQAVMPREAWLALLPDYMVHHLHIQEQVVDVIGDVAAVLQRVSMKATVDGQDRSGIFVISDVWRRTDDGWRVWRRHSTPLSAGALPGAPKVSDAPDPAT